MSIIRDVKNAKMKYMDTVILVKNGNFYRCYDSDSYVVAYIMNYQIKQATGNTYCAGFPIRFIRKG